MPRAAPEAITSSGATQGEYIQDEEAVMEDQVHDMEGEGYASSTPTSNLTWIAWFCSLPGHEYFCEVSEDFIEDDFNLTGLASLVPFWKEAMEMVLDVEPEDSSKIPDVTIVESSAELLYGLVHQRYILTRPGLQAMVEKYEAGHFGTCPRVYCQSTHVAPCGQTDLPGLDTVKLYCPNCNDIYTPPSSRFQGVDGAFFGTTFPHLLFQTFRELAPAAYQPVTPTIPRSPSGYSAPLPFTTVIPHGGQKLPVGKVYVPKIYGFRVSERARSGPRMMWLRMRPTDPEELDRVDYKGRWLEDDYEDDEEDDIGPPGPTSSLFDHDNGDDNDDDEEEEEEEDQGLSKPPPAPTHGRLGRQRNMMTSDWVVAPTQPIPYNLRDFYGSDSEDEDEETGSLPKEIPARPKPFRKSRTNGDIVRVEGVSTGALATNTIDSEATLSSGSSAIYTPCEDTVPEAPLTSSKKAAMTQGTLMLPTFKGGIEPPATMLPLLRDIRIASN